MIYRIKQNTTVREKGMSLLGKQWGTRKSVRENRTGTGGAQGWESGWDYRRGKP